MTEDAPRLAPARAYDISTLVDYAEASIVSRTIAENSAGTVTIFAFESGQGLSEHQAPYDAIVAVIDGQAELVIAGKGVMVKAGQIAVMPANVPHAVRATKGLRFKMILTMLKHTNG